MLDDYFEQFGHKCSLDVDDRFKKFMVNKHRLQLWLMNNAIISSKFILRRGRPRSYCALRNDILAHLEYYPYSLHPFSPIVFYWETFWMFCIYIWLIVIPFDIFRNMDYDDSNEWTRGPGYFQQILSVICLVDSARRFFTGYIIQHKHEDEVVLDFRRIAIHYIKTYYFIDLLSSLPSLVRLTIIGAHPEYGILFELLAFIKLIRFHSTLQLSRITMRYFRINHDANDIIHAILILLFIVHFVTCFSILFGVIDRFVHPASFQWYEKYQQHNQKFSIFNKYAIFLHRSISILGGNGFNFVREKNTVDGMLYVILTTFIGKILTVSIFGFTQTKIVGMRSASDKYQAMINEIESYIKRERLPLTTQKKIKTYCEYKYEHSFFNELAILETAPIVLRNNILLHCAKLLLENVNIFSKLPGAVEAQIVSNLEKEIVLAGDVISRFGEMDNKTYFILNGTLACFSPSGREVFHLDDGQHFGRMAALNREAFSTKVVLETTELSSLSAKDFNSLIGYCPDIVEAIERESEIRLENMVLIEQRFSSILAKQLTIQLQADDENQ